MQGLFRLTVGGALAAVTIILCLSAPVAPQEKPPDLALPLELSLYAGSKSCIECHGKFYQLWAPSHHGLAMQPYTPKFARANLTPQTKDLVIGKYRYRADIGPPAAYNLCILTSKDRSEEALSWCRQAVAGNGVSHGTWRHSLVRFD